MGGRGCREEMAGFRGSGMGVGGWGGQVAAAVMALTLGMG